MTTYAVNPSMFEKLLRSHEGLAPVTNDSQVRLLLVVNPSVLPVQNLQELWRWRRARRRPNYASPSIGTTHHLATELLARDTA